MTEKNFNVTIEIRNRQAIVTTEEIVKRKKSFFSGSWRNSNKEDVTSEKIIEVPYNGILTTPNGSERLTKGNILVINSDGSFFRRR